MICGSRESTEKNACCSQRCLFLINHSRTAARRLFFLSWKNGSWIQFYNRALQFGDIIKLVGVARSQDDNFALANFKQRMLAAHETPIIAINMGPVGKLSRIHRRKPKGKPMPRLTARANAKKSAVRAHVEHPFAHQKGPMGLVIRTIGIARATIMRSEVLLYDEPAAGLDPVTSQRIFDLLRAEQRAARSTVVQTSPVHPGLCTDPTETLERLFEQLVM